MITLLLEVIYIILALLQLLVAPRVDPNPYFGFKIGYTFSSKEVWEKTNRFAGMLMTVHSLAILPLALMGDSHITIYLIAFIAPLIAITIAGVVYASRELERVKGERVSKEKISPIKVHPGWWFFGDGIFLLLLLTILISYPFLPDIVPVHFDLSGNPNGWSDKNDFLISYILMNLLYVGINHLVLYAGKKYPIMMHSGIMRIGRDTVLKATLLTMDLVLVLLFWVYLYIVFFVEVGNNIIFYVILAMTFLVIASPITYIALMWKKNRRGYNVS